MKPYCFHCMTDDPDPVKSDTGEDIYWFVVNMNDLGDRDLVMTGVDLYGDLVSMFQGINEKDFDYTGDQCIVCPDCALDILENGINPDFDD